MTERCPTCGSGVSVVTGGEGTSHYRRLPSLPTPEQLNAVRRLDFGTVTRVEARPFDLPSDYLLVIFEDGFTCGISPQGEVSS